MEEAENINIDLLKKEIEELQHRVERLQQEISHLGVLLKECYALIYYKGAWLSLSDANMKGFKKYVDSVKKERV
tara:strand:+ start:372 stop:593 length:222 start_codon:yes stop_codon:yes gene_type:complete